MGCCGGKTISQSDKNIQNAEEGNLEENLKEEDVNNMKQSVRSNQVQPDFSVQNIGSQKSLKNNMTYEGWSRQFYFYSLNWFNFMSSEQTDLGNKT